MTERPTPDREERLLRELSELGEVPASPAFREELRARFVSGAIRGDEAASAPARDRRPGTRWLRWAIPAAAAVVLALVLAFLNRGAAPELLAVDGRGEVRIGERRIPIADRAGLAAAIVGGARVVVPDGVRLDVRVPGFAVYEITGGTTITLPETPGRWLGRHVIGRLVVGELRLETEPGFAGARLRIDTPEGRVEVSGTLLSVQCDRRGTCVCVLEGTAHVGVDEADLEPVEPGSRKVMMRDGTRGISPVKPMHRDGVLDFARRIRGR